MTNAVTQIVALYESSGLSIEQIAEVENLVVPAVKTVLAANSAKYRSDTQVVPDLGFTPTDEDLALSVIRRVAEHSEDDHTALKAAMFMRNDRRGRLDAAKGLKNMSMRINVQTLNEHFAKAVAAMADKLQPQQKAIDV